MNRGKQKTSRNTRKAKILTRQKTKWKVTQAYLCWRSEVHLLIEDAFWEIQKSKSAKWGTPPKSDVNCRDAIKKAGSTTVFPSGPPPQY